MAQCCYGAAKKLVRPRDVSFRTPPSFSWLKVSYPAGRTILVSPINIDFALLNNNNTTFSTSCSLPSPIGILGNLPAQAKWPAAATNDANNFDDCTIGTLSKMSKYQNQTQSKLTFCDSPFPISMQRGRLFLF